MANAQKGEVSLVLDGDTYTLTVNIDAICQMEEVLSTDTKIVTFQDVVQGMIRGSNRYTRAFFWGAFQTHHPDVTMKVLNLLIEKAGGMDPFIALAKGLVMSTEPDKADLKTLGVSEDGLGPTTASATIEGRADGTGVLSSPRLAARGSRVRSSTG
jgi:hypothetical protein